MFQQFFLEAALLSLAFVSPPAGPNPEPDSQQAVQDNNRFAFDLYGKMSEQKGNLFFSPYSISRALGMTYAGARGETAKDMAQTLHFTLEQNRLHPALGTLIRNQNDAGKKRGYQLSVANALWGQNGFVFDPAFLETNRLYYGAGLQLVDYIQATKQARIKINQWVEKETQNKIKDLLKPGLLTSDSRLVLTNAIYFKAAWLQNFPEKATKIEPFTLANGEKIQASMMQQRDNFSLLENDSFQLLNLPYERGDLSLITLLPKKVDGLPVLEKMANAEKVREWLTGTKRYKVNIRYPKFKFTAEMSLAKTLTDMGMGVAFTPRADFSGMSTQNKLMISEVVHKAFIDLNEKGTEATAATAVLISKTSAPFVQQFPEANFIADHPFLFFIRDNRTGSILFMGRILNPNG